MHVATLCLLHSRPCLAQCLPATTTHAMPNACLPAGRTFAVKSIPKVLNDPAASERKRASQIPYLRREVRSAAACCCLAAAAAAAAATAAADAAAAAADAAAAAARCYHCWLPSHMLR